MNRVLHTKIKMGYDPAIVVFLNKLITLPAPA